MEKEIISNFDLLSEEDMSKYAGMWIAVLNGKVIANSDSFKELYNLLKGKYKEEELLLGKLPELSPMIYTLK